MKKNIFIGLFASSVLLTACSSVRHATTDNETTRNTSPEFINGIKIRSGKLSSSDKKNKYSRSPSAIKGNKFSSSEKQNVSEIQYKYASLLEVSPSDISNISLMELIDDWYGTPYESGGNTKDGIDCSGFSKMLLSNIYNEDVPRTSELQYENCKHIKKDKLREGDLVFFHTYSGSYITHVGIYLQNNKFVHASSHGVMISDLDDDYWHKTYRASGRVKDEDKDRNDDE